MNRAIRGYSKGMRQRTKLAQALVHEPRGAVPRRAAHRHRPGRPPRPDGHHPRLAEAGKSVLVSSHVLHEVQALTPHIVLLHRGRLVAEGHVREIRDLIDKHPHRIVLVCDNYRALAAKLVDWDDVDGVKVHAQGAQPAGRDARPGRFYGRLPALSLQDGHGDRRSLFRRRQPRSRLQVPGEQMNDARLVAPKPRRAAAAPRWSCRPWRRCSA